MTKGEIYEKLSSVVGMGDIIDMYISDVHNSINDAKVQAENNNPLGIAVAIGAADDSLSHLIAAWNEVKNK